MKFILEGPRMALQIAFTSAAFLLILIVALPALFMYWVFQDKRSSKEKWADGLAGPL